MSRPTVRLLVTGLIVTFGGSFHFGYQLGYINPTEPVFRNFFNESFYSHYGSYLSDLEFRIIWSNFVGILLFCATFGVLLMPKFAARFGRKGSLYINTVWFILSFIPSSLAFYLNSFELLILGRIMYGLGSGLSTGLESMYLTEISPNQYRGMLGSMTGFAIQTGVTIGAILGIPNLLGTENRWPILLYIELFPTVLLLIFLTQSAESPNYLVTKGLDKEAEKSLLMYHGKWCETKHIIKSIHNNRLPKKNGGFLSLCKTKLVWKGVILGMLANLAVAFSGIPATSFFATHLLSQAGLTHGQAALANIGIAIGSCTGVILSMWTVDNFGRRSLLLFSCFSLALTNLVMMTLILLYDIFMDSAMAFLLLTVSIVLMVIFGMGLSPIPYFITSELVPEDAKSAGQSVSTMVQFLGGYLSPVLFFSLEGVVGAYSFLVFVIPLVLIAVYFYFFLPETKKAKRRDSIIRLYGRKAVKYLGETKQLYFDENEVVDL